MLEGYAKAGEALAARERWKSAGQTSLFGEEPDEEEGSVGSVDPGEDQYLDAAGHVFPKT